MTATTPHPGVGSTPSVVAGTGLVVGYAVVAAANHSFAVRLIAVTHALLVLVGALFVGVARTVRDFVHAAFGPRGVAAVTKEGAEVGARRERRRAGAFGVPVAARVVRGCAA